MRVSLFPNLTNGCYVRVASEVSQHCYETAGQGPWYLGCLWPTYIIKVARLLVTSANVDWQKACGDLKVAKTPLFF